jgi:hypothetical protein
MSDLNEILPLLEESNTNNITVTWEPKAGLNGVEKLTTITLHDGEIAPNIAFHACDEFCQHEDIQKLVERSEKPSSSEPPKEPIAMKLRPDGNWERRRNQISPPESVTERLTYDQLLFKSPEVELFNAGKQTKSEPAALPNIPSSQICDICTHFGFSVICGGVLALKEECQSDEDRARWAWEAHDRKDLGEQAFQPSFAALAKSARTCASCFLFHTCLPDPTSYALDENRPITIRAGLAKRKDGKRDISHLKVGLPIIDSNHPDEAASIYGKVEIYAKDGVLACLNRDTF